VHNADDDGWWQGELNGTFGIFPSNFVKKIEAPVVVAAPAPAPAPAAAAGKKLVRATHNYDAADADELPLKKGDLITVYEEIDEGWWKGELNGRVGLFPSNFVKEEPAAAAAAVIAPAASLAAADGNVAQLANFPNRTPPPPPPTHTHTHTKFTAAAGDKFGAKKTWSTAGAATAAPAKVAAPAAAPALAVVAAPVIAKPVAKADPFSNSIL